MAQSNHSAHHHHDGSFQEEVLHHTPYAIFSVAFGMVLLGFLDFMASSGAASSKVINWGYNNLFHSFHFLHILFAATGTVITFSRFSKSFTKALIIGIISPTVFCLLSDVLFPYLAGRVLGVDMDLHICFHRELQNVIPFLAIGVINGLVLRKHAAESLPVFSLASHLSHIFVSSLAGMFYMVSHGMSNWYPQMGIIFLLLVIAVVIPCTLSDVIVPMYWAGVKPKGHTVSDEDVPATHHGFSNQDHSQHSH